MAGFSLTGALFHQEKNNATQVDPGTGFLVAQSGEKQRVKGLELGVTGDPIENWTVTANWAYLESETLKSFSNCTVLAASATTGFNCPAGVPAATPIHNAVIERTASDLRAEEFRVVVDQLQRDGLGRRPNASAAV